MQAIKGGRPADSVANYIPGVPGEATPRNKKPWANYIPPTKEEAKVAKVARKEREDQEAVDEISRKKRLAEHQAKRQKESDERDARVQLRALEGQQKALNRRKEVLKEELSLLSERAQLDSPLLEKLNLIQENLKTATEAHEKLSPKAPEAQEAPKAKTPKK